MEYVVVIEPSETNFSAYVPDLPGCVATGDSEPEVRNNIREAIRMHIDGMKEDHQAIPSPTAIIARIAV